MPQNKIASPLKPFCYVISLNGFDQVLCQSIEIGEFERTKNIHGDGDTDRKTPGRKVVPDIVIEKLVPTDYGDPFFWTWFFSAYTSVADALQKDFIITQLDKPFGTPGAKPVRIWAVENAWVHKFKPGKIGDLEDGNSIDTITLACDDIVPQKI
jgi:phage tail-like protein